MHKPANDLFDVIVRNRWAMQLFNCTVIGGNKSSNQFLCRRCYGILLQPCDTGSPFPLDLGHQAYRVALKVRMAVGTDGGHSLGPFAKPKIMQLALKTFVFDQVKVVRQNASLERIEIINDKGRVVVGPTQNGRWRDGFLLQHLMQLADKWSDGFHSD